MTIWATFPQAPIDCDHKITFSHQNHLFGIPGCSFERHTWRVFHVIESCRIADLFRLCSKLGNFIIVFFHLPPLATRAKFTNWTTAKEEYNDMIILLHHFFPGMSFTRSLLFSCWCRRSINRPRSKRNDRALVHRQYILCTLFERPST